LPVDPGREGELDRLVLVEVAHDAQRSRAASRPLIGRSATSGASRRTSSSSPSNGIVSPEW
jgi:hypothetical protein